jgi:hypothetical protein
MDKKQIDAMISAFYRDCLKKGDLESLSYDEKNRWKYYDYGFTATPMMKIHTYPGGYEELHQRIFELRICQHNAGFTSVLSYYLLNL